MPEKLRLKQFSVGSMDNNVYIVIDATTGDSVLFDAPTDAPEILRALAGTQLKAILMTHTDADHVQALESVREATGAPVGVHPLDAARLPAPADFEIEDGQVLECGSLNVRAMHTPGHTPGSVSFEVDGMLFSGDTLFPGGPGNTHDSRDHFRQIIDGIRNKLFVLPDDTPVYPGHGLSTTIGAEKPHLQEWVERGY